MQKFFKSCYRQSTPSGSCLGIELRYAQEGDHRVTASCKKESLPIPPCSLCDTTECKGFPHLMEEANVQIGERGASPSILLVVYSRARWYVCLLLIAYYEVQSCKVAECYSCIHRVLWAPETSAQINFTTSAQKVQPLSS